jgi:streptogramin lyase
MRRLIVLVLAAALMPTAAGGKAPPPPATGAVVQTGQAPCGADARAGSIWVGVYGTGKLLQLEDTSGRVESQVGVGRWACRVAVGPAAVWITRDRAGEIVRVSRGNGRIQRTKVGTWTFDVLLAAGSVWATSFEVGTVARIDPGTGRLTHVFKVGGNPAGLAYCGGRIWVGHGRTATWLTSIDPATRETRRVEVFDEAPGWPTCIRGVLWITSPDSVVRVDPRTGRLLTSLPIGETLADAAAGPDGLVWVTDKQHSVVHRLTPDGRHVLDSFPAGPGAFALARAGGAMWVTSFAGSDVRRFVP